MDGSGCEFLCESGKYGSDSTDGLLPKKKKMQPGAEGTSLTQGVKLEGTGENKMEQHLFLFPKVPGSFSNTS